jgi:hypothetical protein
MNWTWSSAHISWAQVCLADQGEAWYWAEVRILGRPAIDQARCNEGAGNEAHAII